MKLHVFNSTVRRLTSTDEEEGKAMAAFATKKLFKTAVVITDSNLAASEMRAKGFSERFSALGGAVLTQLSYAGGEGGLRRVVRMAAYHKPDVFYLPGGRTDTAGLIEEMKQQGVLASVLGSTDWDVRLGFPAAVGPAAAVFAPCRFHAGSSSIVTADFVSRFKAANRREPGLLEALGYDAGLVIFDALARADKAHDAFTREVAAVKLLSGATGQLTARRWSLTDEITVLRLRGRTFVFDSVVKLK